MTTSDAGVSAVRGALHTGITVSDLDRALNFYVTGLGLELLSRMKRSVTEDAPSIVGYLGATLRIALVGIPGTTHRLELVEYRGVLQQQIDAEHCNPGTGHLCLQIEGLVALYNKLSAMGVQFVTEPLAMQSPIMGTMTGVYAVDPDGYRVELLDFGGASSAPAFIDQV